MCMVHSSVVQFKYQKVESTDVNLENLTNNNFSKLSKLYPIIDDLKNINPKYRNKVLQNYLSFNIFNTDLYLINRKESEKFVTLIKDDLFKEMSHVIEINPGFGLLTESLLEAGIPFLTLYEKNNDFYSDLHNLYMKYPKRFVLKKANLFKMSKTLNSHNFTTSVGIAELLKNVPKKKWDESTCIQMIGTTTSSLFLKHLIMSALFQSSFMSCGRASFYFAMSPFIWNKCTTFGHRLNTTYIMFNTLFNYKMFGTLDRNAFIPWQKKVTVRKNTNQSRNCHVLYVVKLEPKTNIHTMFGDKENLIDFWYFIRHHFYVPSQRIIPALEKHIPNCGIRLIQKNYNIFTEFGELNLTQIHDLFMELQTWPEYEASTLILRAHEMRKMYNSHIEEEQNLT
ncbi:Dimethyladenosine transferase 2, mitochondrial [Anthophora retusa]